MQQKQLTWLVGSLVALLTVALVSGAFDAEVSTIDVPALSISSEQIEEFEIVTSDSSVFQLKKTQQRWYITSPIEDLADSLTLSRFIKNLDDLRLEAVVTTNPNKYEEYGVGPNSKHINITWGRNKKTFYIGKSESGFQSFYIRMAKDQRVFLSNGRLNLPENIDTWRDKTVLDLPAQSINQIAVTSPATKYDILKTGNNWEITEDRERNDIDSDVMTAWLSHFSPLKATAFISNLSPAEVKSQATHQVHFSVPGQITRTIWLVEEENQLSATVSGKSAVFRLSPGQLPDFVPTPDQLTQQ